MIDTIQSSAGDAIKIERRDAAPHACRVGWIDKFLDRYSMAVHFGLHAIRGNRFPYLTITVGHGYINGRDSFGGCCHDEIAEQLPELRDLIALHLSYMTGEPMHAEANGWYQLAGALGGLGEQYHAGNAETYGRTRDCWQSFADHCRITVAEARSIGNVVMSHDMSQYPWKERTANKRRVVWTAACAGMRPRWRAEMRAAIVKYSLTIYGDRQRTHAETLAEFDALP